MILKSYMFFAPLLFLAFLHDVYTVLQTLLLSMTQNFIITVLDQIIWYKVEASLSSLNLGHLALHPIFVLTKGYGFCSINMPKSLWSASLIAPIFFRENWCLQIDFSYSFCYLVWYFFSHLQNLTWMMDLHCTSRVDGPMVADGLKLLSQNHKTWHWNG